MEKFAAVGAAKDAIDPAAPTEVKLRRLAQVLGKPVTELKVFVLEKPRHNRLIDEVRALGAEAALYPAGDVAGAIAAALGDGTIDALMGTGGAGEGILSACAVRAVGGTFWGRFDPQLATERARVRAAGLSTERWHRVEELVMSPEVLFCATGITTGLLVEGVRRDGGRWRTQTLMLDGRTGERQLLTTWPPVRAAQQEVEPCP
jgi:fructose-1,6-bisphosphatase II